jgi:hypothetical protein
VSEEDKVFHDILKELVATNQNIIKQLDVFNKKHQEVFTEVINQNLARSVVLQQMAEYLKNPQTIADYVVKDHTKQNERMMQQLTKQFRKACLLFSPETIGMNRLNTKINSSPSNPVNVNQNTSLSNPNYSSNTTDLIKYAQNAYAQVYNTAYYRVGYLPSLTTTFAAINDSSVAFPITDVMSTAQTLDIVSDNAQDKGTAPTGTGVQQVTIEGLNNSGIRASETLTLNGTTKVTTSTTFKQIDAMYAISTGTNNSANGNITAYKTSQPPIYAVILASGNAWRSGRFYSDINGTGYIDAWNIGCFSNNNTVRGQLRTTETASNFSAFITRASVIVENDTIQLVFPVPIIIPKSMTAMVRGITNTSTAEVNTSFELHFIT